MSDIEKKNNLMSLKGILKNITIEKWLLIGGCGIVLILCSDSCSGDKKKADTDEDTSKATAVEESLDEYVSNLEKKLEDIISKVDGAGDVQVMITVKNTSTKEVLTEDSLSEKKLNETDSDGGVRDSYEISKDENVVVSEEGNSVKSPFVVSELTPEVEGVAVIVQGGDSPIVKEKITGIIKALFGIEINKIAVGKMK